MSDDLSDSHVMLWRLHKMGVSITIPESTPTNLNAFLAERRCPDCNGFIFRPGPRGGMSQNIECVCGSRFNITYYRGDLIWAERIDGNGAWREDKFPKVLQ